MANRLAHETSPYLQQHADNPVDWHPWSEEALARARAEDRPILLSIGYSACHWCHVMAHESFEDPATADVMNRHFVNIKVDREERPDLDQIYQTAHQMLTRKSGGWPLTVLLMPDGTPFFAGTYFPKEPRYGRPGLRGLLEKLAEAYRTRRSEIIEQNAALMDAFGRTTPAPAGTVELTRAPVDAVVDELDQAFDDVHGGIGSAPKFPHPFELACCLRRYSLEGTPTAGAITRLTLVQMAEGGIYDHLGGGFCRYSTDRFWTIPHFEKMLYDNGPLLALYGDAWLVFRDAIFEKSVRETAAWVMREMQSPEAAGEGGYYSSIDADSEGEEGKFYVWRRDEIEALLSPHEYEVVAPHFGLDREPNFESVYWNLRISQPLAAVAATLGREVSPCEEAIDSARGKLFKAREQRVRPGRDDKVLGSWNALMIKGMARAGRVFAQREWIGSAQRATDFIHATLWKDGRLRATYKDGRAHLNAYLDDYAFLLDALLELMQSEFRPCDLAFAQALAEVLLAHFEDSEHGGFYFVSHDHEKLIHRSKTAHDNATPSGNGVAAHALQRLGHLVGEPRYIAAAERTAKVFFEALLQSASAHVSLVTALEELLAPPRIVILRGRGDAIAEWQARLDQTYRPDTMVLGVADGLPDLPPALEKTGLPGSHAVSAWICQGVTCLPPVFDLAELEQVIAHAPATG
jgi:hypothetical protein